MKKYSNKQIKKILDREIKKFPLFAIEDRNVVFWTDIHLNKDGYQNNSKHLLPILLNSALPYFKTKHCLHLGGGDIVDIWEAGSYEEAMSYKPNRLVEEHLILMFLEYSKGNHDEEIESDPNAPILSYSKGLRLCDRNGNVIGFFTHGDIVDWFNKPGWFTKHITRPFVRHVWTWIEKHLLRRLPTEYSPAKNRKYGKYLNKAVMDYCREKKIVGVIGHTHIDRIKLFTEGGLFLNCGSWVEQGGTVGAYIDGQFLLIKWLSDKKMWCSNGISAGYQEFV